MIYLEKQMVRECKKLKIVDHDPRWQIIFQDLKEIYQEHLGDMILGVEHVGSTAVPGLCAKPCLDVDVVIEDYSKFQAVKERLSEIGYRHQGDLGITGREAFKRVDEKVPWDGSNSKKMAHHLYVCPKNSEELERHIAFRDYLKENSDIKKEYGELKKRLVSKYRRDRAAYTEAKTKFIETLLERIDLQ